MHSPPGNQTDRLNTALAGRYHIERHLGEGGMSTVYLCDDLKHDRKVALKLLKPELAAERFVQEIKTTAALQHPHILPLFDSGAADGFLFYVMLFIDGETWRTKLDRETQLGVDEAVRIVREVLDALHYAHEHGIVHRDVKPENILLHGGHAMVADFGIALAVSAAAGGRMTETGVSLGTPHYMSPEQSVSGGISPMWSRDGRKIYYWSASQFIEAILSMNPIFRVASRRMLFSADYQAGYGHAAYDVMPDGASFLMMRSVENRRDEIVVVHNFKALLKSQAKDAKVQ